MKNTLVAAVVGALAGTAVMGGIAWAAIPDDAGVIHGCYTKLGGVLRVIDITKGQKCVTHLEVPITWNQSGPRGEPGPAGADGARGPQGPAAPLACEAEQRIKAAAPAFVLSASCEDTGGGDPDEPARLVSVTLAGADIPVGEHGLVVVHLDRPAPGDTTVSVTVDDPSIVVGLLREIVIPAGTRDGSSTFIAVAPGTTTIRATLAGTEKSIMVTVARR